MSTVTAHDSIILNAHFAEGKCVCVCVSVLKGGGGIMRKS